MTETPEPLTPDPPPPGPTTHEPRRARLTVRVTACHEAADGRPSAASLARDRRLEADEQPFVRRLKVGEEWAPLERGWLEEASWLVLENEGSEGVLELGAVPPQPSGRRTMHSPPAQPAEPAVCLVARPGFCAAGEPGDLKLLRVRCRRGAARAAIHLFPS